MSSILITLNGLTMQDMHNLHDLFKGVDTEDSQAIRDSLIKLTDDDYVPSGLTVHPFRGEAKGTADVHSVVNEVSEFVAHFGITAPIVVYYANERDSGEYPLDNCGRVVVDRNNVTWGESVLDDTVNEAVRDGFIRDNHIYLHTLPEFIRYEGGEALFMFPDNPAVYSIKATVRGDFHCHKALDMRSYIGMGNNCSMSLSAHAFPDIKSAFNFIRAEAIHA